MTTSLAILARLMFNSKTLSGDKVYGFYQYNSSTLRGRTASLAGVRDRTLILSRLRVLEEVLNCSRGIPDDSSQANLFRSRYGIMYKVEIVMDSICV